MIPLSIIQRFIIYHRKYACRDESASLAELSEYIIYYYDINYISPPNNGNDDDNAYDHYQKQQQQQQQHDNIHYENDESTDDSNSNSNSNNSDIGSHWYHSSFQQRQETPYAFNAGRDIVTEAIKFAGFCEALEGFADAFPSSSPSSSSSSSLEDVQLVDSTLIFVKLEEDSDIIAVAQIDRRDLSLGEVIKDAPDGSVGGHRRPHGRKSRNASLDHVKSMMSKIGGSGSGPVERRSMPISIQPIPEDMDGVAADEWGNGWETKKTIPVGGDPRALREALRRCHGLFMMLKGGGIAQRMNGNGSIQTSDGDMTRLFSLRKQIRKTELEMENLENTPPTPSPSPMNDTNDENTPTHTENTPPTSLLSYKQTLSTLRSQITSLLPTLPITALKRDLRSHYDAFFDTLTLRASRWGFNAGRCLVELLAPHADGLREDLSPHARWRGCRSVPNARATLVVSRLTTALLGGRWRNGGLEGVAVFYGGTLLSREAMGNDAERAGILFRYMCAHSPRRDDSSGGNVTKRGTIASFVKRFHGSITGAPKMEEEECRARQRHHHGHRRQEEEDAASAGSDDAVGVSSDRGYLHPPPLSSTGPMESVDAVTIPPFGSIWMPKVWDGGDGWRVLVYEYTKLGLGFLFYLREDKVLILPNGNHTKEKETVRLGYSSLSFGNDNDDHDDGNDMNHDTNEDETQPQRQNGLIVKTASFFQSLADTISESLDNFCQEDISDPTMIAQPTYKGEPGLDLIYVDRYEHTVTIVPDPQRTNDSSSSHTIKKHFINKEAGQQQQQSSLLTALASHLPHGILLSFDDILTEWHAADDNDGEKEICSFLSGRWVFGRKQADRELFLIFDANKFVTIADVHKAVFRVRKDLLDNTLL